MSEDDKIFIIPKLGGYIVDIETINFGHGASINFVTPERNKPIIDLKIFQIREWDYYNDPYDEFAHWSIGYIGCIIGCFPLAFIFGPIWHRFTNKYKICNKDGEQLDEISFIVGVLFTLIFWLPILIVGVI